MLNMSLILLLALINLSYQTIEHFPEDYNDIQYLTTNIGDRDEIYIIGFYPSDSTTPLKDKRNGVLIYPYKGYFNSVGVCINGFSYRTGINYPNGYIDSAWNENQGTFCSSYALLDKYYQTTNLGAFNLITISDLQSHSTIINNISFYEVYDSVLRPGINAINYFWHQVKIDKSTTLSYYDIEDQDCSVSTPTSVNTNTFSLNSNCQNCIFQTWIPIANSISIDITNPFSKGKVYFESTESITLNYMRLTLQFDTKNYNKNLKSNLMI